MRSVWGRYPVLLVS